MFYCALTQKCFVLQDHKVNQAPEKIVQGGQPMQVKDLYSNAHVLVIT